MHDLLSTEPDLGVTALRKPQAKIASHLKQLDWQMMEYQLGGVSDGMIATAERQKTELAQLADQIEARVSERKSRRAQPN